MASERNGSEGGMINCKMKEVEAKLAFMEEHYCFCKGADKWKVTCPYHMKFPTAALPAPPSAPETSKEKA